MSVYIIADTHFCHENIIRFCNRPFQDVHQMNEEMIKRWNNTVKKTDTVIHLGDFGFGTKATLTELCQRLQGRKILVKGNHDRYKDEDYRKMGFAEVYKYPILYKSWCLMSHEPLQLSETTPYFNFYGHVHNDEKYQDSKTTKCVSVERIDYTPYKIL